MPRPPAAGMSLRIGDRVRYRRGSAKGELGTVVENTLPNGTRSIHPRSGIVFVLFDRAHGLVIEAEVEALEKVKTPSTR